MASPTLRSRVESILFVASEPVSEKELCAVTGAEAPEVRAAIAELRKTRADSGLALREVGGGYRLTSNPDCRDDVERFLLPPKTHIWIAAGVTDMLLPGKGGGNITRIFE